jgi:hydroxylysine kinase
MDGEPPGPLVTTELVFVLEPSMTTVLDHTPTQEINILLRDRYGIHGVAERLSSERDELFSVSVKGQFRYVLRLANPAETREVTDLQTRALLWLSEIDPTLPVPRLVPTLGGEVSFVLPHGAGRDRAVRLMSYLHGRPLHESRRSLAQRRRIGATLARVANALCGFEHPADRHELAWDIKHFHRLRGLLPAEVEARWEFVHRCFDVFEAEIAPRIHTLPSQVVHNDFNLHNILVDPVNLELVTGILDFGDMVRTPRVFDLAVAASYHLDDAAPVAGAAALVSGYHDVLPLQDDEIDLLYDLIAVRLAATVIITEWRAERQPSNRDYILRNTERAWKGLAQLDALTRADVLQEFRKACESVGDLQ